MSVNQGAPKKYYSNGKVFGWELGADDTGLPIEMSKLTDRTIHIFSLGAAASFFGAAASFQWSNDTRADPNDPDHANASWLTAIDVFGDLIESVTADAGFQIMPNSLWCRPVTTGGDTGGTSRIVFNLNATRS